MAKIQKVDLNQGQKIINPFKTKRNSSTNPFKYQDFEGNTIDPLVCADVLVSFKSNPAQNKLKMVTSSVMGSITKLHNSITEPIVNFVKRIGSLWEYAKTTDISDVGRSIGHSISDSVSGIGHSISGTVSNLGKSISDRIPLLGTDVTELTNGISDKWQSLVKKVNHKKISKDTPVAELRIMLEEELALAAKEAA